MAEMNLAALGMMPDIRQPDQSLASLGFRQSDNIEDRRNDLNPNRAEWANVIPHLKQLPGRILQYYKGVPIPEEAAPTDLSRQLGHLDIGKGIPNYGSTSPLEYVLYDIEHGLKTIKDVGRAFKNELQR